jgi:hypothetical protein
MRARQRTPCLPAGEGEVKRRDLRRGPDGGRIPASRRSGSARAKWRSPGRGASSPASTAPSAAGDHVGGEADPRAQLRGLHQACAQAAEAGLGEATGAEAAEAEEAQEIDEAQEIKECRWPRRRRSASGSRPPVTKKQNEEFEEAVEERRVDPTTEARNALRVARRSLEDLEDALDRL